MMGGIPKGVPLLRGIFWPPAERADLLSTESLPPQRRKTRSSSSLFREKAGHGCMLSCSPSHVVPRRFFVQVFPALPQDTQVWSFSSLRAAGNMLRRFPVQGRAAFLSVYGRSMFPLPCLVCPSPPAAFFLRRAACGKRRRLPPGMTFRGRPGGRGELGHVREEAVRFFLFFFRILLAKGHMLVYS